MKWIVLMVVLAGCVQPEPMAEREVVGDLDEPGGPQYATEGPSFAGGEWIDESFTHAGLQGTVFMVDFWTYSCINCIRTFPHITALYDTYHPYGLEIIGVHSPEFDFEKERKYVIEAMDEYGINYPVVQDNDFQIWKSYENHHWPAHFLYDATGELRQKHIGEGDYLETELLVRELLMENGVTELPPIVEGEDGRGVRGSGVTRELYAGYWRQPEALGQGTTPEETRELTIPAAPTPHQIYLEGTWYFGEEYVRAESNGTVQLTFKAGGANFVADGEGCIPVRLDGYAIGEENKPFEGECIQLEGPDSYDFYKGEVGTHKVQFWVPEGFELYTFAFSRYAT